MLFAKVPISYYLRYIMSRNFTVPARGRILIAEPLLGDPNFDRTVVLLADHNAEGTVGFVLNRPVDLDFDELVLDFPSFDAAIFEGGPVQEDNLFFLHSKGELIPGSEEIMNGVYWGGDLEILKEMIALEMVAPGDIKFFLGYSGWSTGQLNDELASKSWLVAESHSDLIFNTEIESLWSTIMKQLGGDYALWHNAPMDPSLN
ncbi:MAG: YqgE/AlgH family protein [Croceimicrobium sp.]